MAAGSGSVPPSLPCRFDTRKSDHHPKSILKNYEGQFLILDGGIPIRRGTIFSCIASLRSRFVTKQEKFYWRWNSRPQSRDAPPTSDTGIANENLLNENVNESGTNEDESGWFSESG